MVTDTKPYIDPKEFFHPDDNRIPPGYSGFIGKSVPYACAILGGTLGLVVDNWARRRPTFAGPVRFLMVNSALLYLVNWHYQYTEETRKKKNYFLYTYIRDHPDEFPLVERQKFATYFERWRPCR